MFIKGYNNIRNYEKNFKIIKKYINPHDDHWVNSIIFSKNKILISSSIYDDKVKIWDIFSKLTQPIQQLNHRAQGLLEWDENIFISSGYSKTKIWNKIKGQLNYQLMNIFQNIAPYRNNGIKKYDDNSIIIGGLNYKFYIINLKTMEVIKKSFHVSKYDIYSILNLEKYLILGGEIQYSREKEEEYQNKKEYHRYLDELEKGFIHIYKKEGNNKFNLIKKIEHGQKSTVKCIEMIKDNNIIFGDNIIPLNELIN